MKIIPRLALASAIVVGMGAVQPVRAATTDQWVVRVGVHLVSPRSHNGNLAGMQASIDNSVRPTASIEYLVTPHWGVDALVAWPFHHRVKLDGQLAATTRDLPPTVGVNYHFLPDARVSPFVGLGVNYTRFFDTHGKGILDGANVKIANSWGPAAHTGLDFALSQHWLITADVRWMSIRGNVHVNGTWVGKAKVDPWCYGLSIGYRF